MIELEIGWFVFGLLSGTVTGFIGTTLAFAYVFWFSRRDEAVKYI